MTAHILSNEIADTHYSTHRADIVHIASICPYHAVNILPEQAHPTCLVLCDKAHRLPPLLFTSGVIQNGNTRDILILRVTWLAKRAIHRLPVSTLMSLLPFVVECKTGTPLHGEKCVAYYAVSV